MSYCNFRTDSFMSDVHAYQDDEGNYVCKVAGKRFLNEAVRRPEPFMYPEWYKFHHAMMDWIDNARRVKIKHEYAGKTYTFSKIKELQGFLMALENEGFYVPFEANYNILRSK